MSNGIIQGNVTGIYLASITIDPASVATITTAEQTFTVPGVKVGDAVFVCKPSNTTGLGIGNSRASAANQIGVTFINPTAGAVDAASETWIVVYIRPQAAPVLNAAVND